MRQTDADRLLLCPQTSIWDEHVGMKPHSATKRPMCCSVSLTMTRNGIGFVMLSTESVPYTHRAIPVQRRLVCYGLKEFLDSSTNSAACMDDVEYGTEQLNDEQVEFQVTSVRGIHK